MLKTKLRRTSLILLAIVLMLSVFSMTAFAEETVAADDVLSAEADGETVADATLDDAADKGEATDDTATDDSATTGDKAADDGHDHDHDDETTTDGEGFGTSDLVSLILFGIVVIAVVVYCIVKREKVGAFCKSLKSEFKKITWSPWSQVRKNTIVVLIVVISLAIVIGVADLIFMKGITALSVLF